MAHPSKLTPSDRDRALARLGRLTTGTGVGALLAVGGFSYIAAASYSGKHVTAAVPAAVATTAAASTAASAAPTAAATATAAPTVAPTVAPTAAPTAPPVVVTGGS